MSIPVHPETPVLVAAGTVRPALSEQGFAEAVRDALRSLGRPDHLRGSPLLDSSLVRSQVGDLAAVTERVAVLRRTVTTVAATLAVAPRDRRAYRALHHTYLQPAETQRDAARLLHLPLSTYRRHLAVGVRRLTELLWEQETTTLDG